MYRNVLKYSVGILGLLMAMLSGFTQSFKSVADKTDDDESYNFLIITTKMIGDLSANANHSTFKQMLLLLFIFLMCIILLNMLIGIAVGELNMLVDGAEMIQRELKVKFSLNVQKFLSICETSGCISEQWMISNKPIEFLVWIDHKLKSIFAKSSINNKKDEIESLTNFQTNMNFNIKQTLNMIEINLKNTQAQFIEIRSSNALLDANIVKVKDDLKDVVNIKEQLASVKDDLKDVVNIKEQLASVKDDLKNIMENLNRALTSKLLFFLILFIQYLILIYNIH
jgi:hypothetical protein